MLGLFRKAPLLLTAFTKQQTPTPPMSTHSGTALIAEPQPSVDQVARHFALEYNLPFLEVAKIIKADNYIAKCSTTGECNINLNKHAQSQLSALLQSNQQLQRDTMRAAKVTDLTKDSIQNVVTLGVFVAASAIKYCSNNTANKLGAYDRLASEQQIKSAKGFAADHLPKLKEEFNNLIQTTEFKYLLTQQKNLKNTIINLFDDFENRLASLQFCKSSKGEIEDIRYFIPVMGEYFRELIVDGRKLQSEKRGLMLC